MKVNRRSPKDRRLIKDIVKEVLGLSTKDRTPLTAKTVSFFTGGAFRVDYLGLHPLMHPMIVPSNIPKFNLKEMRDMAGALNQIQTNLNALTQSFNAHKAKH